MIRVLPEYHHFDLRQRRGIKRIKNQTTSGIKDFARCFTRHQSRFDLLEIRLGKLMRERLFPRRFNFDIHNHSSVDFQYSCLLSLMQEIDTNAY